MRKQSDGIERQTVQAFATPLRDIEQAAAQVRQNVKETSWLMIGLILATGLLIGFLLAYWPLKSSQNNMQEQMNRIEQSLAAQQSRAPAAAPAAPDVHGSGHKGKAK